MPSPTSFLANLYAMRSGQPVMGQYGRTQAGMQAHEERFELEGRARELEEEFQKRGRQAEKREGRRGRGRAVGSLLGAILGQALIPIPGVGAAIGAGIGSGAGQMAGTRRAFTLAHPFGEKRRPTLKKLQLQPLKGKFFKQGRESLASEQKDINRQLKDIDKMFKESIGTSLLTDALTSFMFAEGGGFERLGQYGKAYLPGVFGGTELFKDRPITELVSLFGDKSSLPRYALPQYEGSFSTNYGLARATGGMGSPFDWLGQSYIVK